MIKKIALCDSGVGGLFLLKKLTQQFPYFDYLYISDKQNLPYGNKSKNQIKGYCYNVIERAVKFGADLLIVACNTMSEIGEKTFLTKAKIPVLFVRHNMRKILGSNMKKSKFFCTKATAKSSQIKALSKLSKSFVSPLENLALDVENHALNLEFFCPDFLKDTHNEIKNVYLGCTHYVLILNKFKSAFPKAKIYDGSEEIIEILKSFVYQNTQCNKPTKKVFIGSGNFYALKVFKLLTSQ